MIYKLYKLYLRKFFPHRYARYIGVQIGKNSRLINVSWSTEPYLITIGDNFSATNVRFETHDGGCWVFRETLPEIDSVKPIIIGNNVFIGYGALILPGVKIGDNVVVGAGSIVSRDLQSNAVYAGVPAKRIKSLGDYKVKLLANSDSTKLMNENSKRKYYLSKYK